MRVVSVRGLGPNLTVTAVDQDLGFLVDGTVASGSVGLCLGSSTFRGFGVADTLDLPAAGGVCNYVLILSQLVPKCVTNNKMAHNCGTLTLVVCALKREKQFTKVIKISQKDMFCLA